MWHILSFILCPSFLFSVSHVSSPSIKSDFQALTDHVGHDGQDRSEIKAGKGFGFIWFWFVLCEEFRFTFSACYSQKTDSFTSWFRYLGIDSWRACLTLPLWDHVFCMYLFLYIYIDWTVSMWLKAWGLPLVSVGVQTLLPLESIVCSIKVPLWDTDLYFHLLHMFLALMTVQFQLCAHAVTFV